MSTTPIMSELKHPKSVVDRRRLADRAHRAAGRTRISVWISDNHVRVLDTVVALEACGKDRAEVVESAIHGLRDFLLDLEDDFMEFLCEPIPPDDTVQAKQIFDVLREERSLDERACKGAAPGDAS